ncbi:MAG: FmdB family zinc ribbon protein [Sandaracinaceae bacterium]
MPTYDYGCRSCGHEWELEQRISEDPVRKCPSCSKMKAQRLISGGNFILKGSGWYADLYHKPAATKSDAKPDAKGSEASTSKPSEASPSGGDGGGAKPAGGGDKKTGGSASSKAA